MSENRELLFPYGVYKQRVTLTVPETPGGSGFSGKRVKFSGLAQVKPEVIRVVILSPFGTTVAKLEEDRVTGQVKSEIFAEAMKKHEERVREYYSSLKYVMVAPARPDKDSHLHWLKSDELGRPLEIETRGLEHNARFRFVSYDEHGIPERILFDRLEHGVEVEVEVTGYDL